MEPKEHNAPKCIKQQLSAKDYVAPGFAPGATARPYQEQADADKQIQNRPNWSKYKIRRVKRRLFQRDIPGGNIWGCKEAADDSRQKSDADGC